MGYVRRNQINHLSEHQTWSADQVWALSVRAYTVNNGYYKEPVFEKDHMGYPCNMHQPVKQPNKVLLKQWLRHNEQPSDQELAQGRECRKHFDIYSFWAVAGKLSSFQVDAFRVASLDQFNGANQKDLGLVSCLPWLVQREQIELQSRPWPGQPGEQIQASVTVMTCKLSLMVSAKYSVTALSDHTVLQFFYRRELTVGQNLQIRARIKEHRNNLTTALHFVKIISS